MKTSHRFFSLLAGAFLITGTALGDEVGANRNSLTAQPAHAEKAVAGEYDVDRDILNSVK